MHGFEAIKLIVIYYDFTTLNESSTRSPIIAVELYPYNTESPFQQILTGLV